MIQQEIKYPVGIQSFQDIRERGFLYVDKSAFVNELKKGKYYFLSRPRRFGKSLLLSTLEAYYQGRRDLFKGLALDDLTDDWEPRPVLHLDMNNGDYTTPDGLLSKLNHQVSDWENDFGIPLRDGNDERSGGEGSVSLRFGNIIKRLSEQTGKKVVILVDEYDKPLLNTIHLPELNERYRWQLKAFYSNLKTMDPYIEMAMLTGVARFSKVSIFSDLNNLSDISFDKKYAGICGITSEELDLYFRKGIENLAIILEMDQSAVREKLRRNYDGYHFSVKSPDIYNPFSLMSVFARETLGDFWFASGTPTYLVRLIENGEYPFSEIAPIRIDRRYLESAGLLDSDPIPAFYQSGYLTIKDYDSEFNEYTLGYPNEEVKYGFLNFLMRNYIPAIERRGFSIPDFVREIRAGKAASFMKRMESLIASVPYNEKGSAEGHFQNAVYLLFTLLGQYTRMEDRTSDGRIDLQVETSDYVYIFEFKVNSSSEAAMAQIRKKSYWLREAVSGKEIFLIGANFDTSTRRMTAPLIEQP